MANVLAPTQLQDLPEHVLLNVIRHCNEKELAKLICTSRMFRAPAEELDIWKALSEKRWPLGDVRVYQGNWRAYYASRMALPASLPSNIDQAVRLTAQAQQADQQGARHMPASTQEGRVCDLFGRFMQSALSVGILLEVAPQVRKSKEHTRFSTACSYWLEAHPQVAISSVRELIQELQQQGVRGMGEATWQRSALAFVMHAAQHTAHASILQRLQAELSKLDACLRIVRSSYCHTQAPIGVPKSHWWYHPAPTTVAAC